MNSYRFSQICINGHIITDSADHHAKISQKYCEKCGKEVISSCQNCQTKIKGREELEKSTFMIATGSGVLAPRVKELSMFYEKPLYCYHCSNAFPWVESTISDMMDIANSQKELSEENSRQLHDAIIELSKNSSKSKIAAFKFNEIIRKVGKTDIPHLFRQKS